MTHTDDHRPPDGDGQLTALLARARRSLSPSAADAERVERALAGALAVAPDAGHAPSPDAPVAAARAGRAWSWGGKLLAGATIAAVAGSAGYLAGARAERRASRSIARLAPPPAPLDAPPLVGTPQPQSQPTPTPPASAPAAAISAGAPGPRPARAAPRPPAAPSLEEEVRAVRAVERALRDGRAGLALALLRELDRTIPDGRLGEERAATEAIARCTLDQIPLDVRPAEDFAAHHPESPYLERVRKACAAKRGDE